jgi:hypothetical protein
VPLLAELLAVVLVDADPALALLLLLDPHALNVTTLSAATRAMQAVFRCKLVNNLCLSRWRRLPQGLVGMWWCCAKLSAYGAPDSITMSTLPQDKV